MAEQPSRNASSREPETRLVLFRRRLFADVVLEDGRQAGNDVGPGLDHA